MRLSWNEICARAVHHQVAEEPGARYRTARDDSGWRAASQLGQPV